MPPIKSRGINTAKRIILVDKIAKITFLEPVAAALRGESPFSTL